jgi:DNA (cytosine-5)-methyltransferase 1
MQRTLFRSTGRESLLSDSVSPWVSIGMVLPPKAVKLATILHKTDGSEPFIDSDGDKYFDHERRKVQPKYTLSDHLWTYLQQYAEKHRLKGNGFGFGLVTPKDIARTLSARYYKDGSEILIKQRKNPRRLTPRECARLMGLPDSFVIPVSDTRAYKQFGNSVAVPVVRAVAELMKQFVVASGQQTEIVYPLAAE